MSEYIERDLLAQEMCKFICGRDSDLCVSLPKDCHQEKMMAIYQIPAADVAPVVHGRWKYYRKQGVATCTICSFERKLDDDFGRAVSCPNCGAKMYKEEIRMGIIDAFSKEDRTEITVSQLYELVKEAGRASGTFEKPPMVSLSVTTAKAMFTLIGRT